MKGNFLKQCFCVFAGLMLYFSCSSADPVVRHSNMLADVEPFSVGSVNASFDKALSSNVTETKVEVVFYPRKNEVALEFKYETIRYWQFWDEAGRRQFIEALNRYKEDFADRKLITNYGKSRAVYGKIKGRSEWKTLPMSATYRSSPSIELGYRFKREEPYFSAQQMKAKEESGANPKNISESRQFAMYFTIAQGEDLVRLFDQAFLLESLGGKP